MFAAMVRIRESVPPDDSVTVVVLSVTEGP